MALIECGKPETGRAYTGTGKGAISKKSMRNSCSECGTVQKVTLLTPGTDSTSATERDIRITAHAAAVKLKKAAARVSDKLDSKAEWW